MKWNIHQKYLPKSIADGFAAASDVGVTSCTGEINGNLIWTQKPSEKHTFIAGIGRGNILW